VKNQKPAQPKPRGRKKKGHRGEKCTPGFLKNGKFDSGWKKGENAEAAHLGTKNQPRRTIEVDALLKWVPDLLGRCRAADSWPDPDRHPHIPAVLLRTVAPLLEAVAEALDGKPDRLQHLHNQILSTGTRRKRTIAELDETLRPLLEDPTIEWHRDGSTSATLAALHAHVEKRITKPGLRNKLQRLGIRYGVPDPDKT
jgi:hypothetical protein